jgi:L-lactate dehydrogenase complex protein LldF
VQARQSPSQTEFANEIDSAVSEFLQADHLTGIFYILRCDFNICFLIFNLSRNIHSATRSDHMHLSPQYTKKYIKKALHNDALRKAVGKATDTSVSSRQALVDQMPYWEDFREKAHEIKKQVIENLDSLLVQFEENCQKNGIQVHWALDAAEAREITLSIAQENHVKNIVKSKSLTTEEIHLNDFLQQNAIEVLETDLGEYIVQLMDQIPSHLIIPAMHLSRQDIGKLFHEKLGVPYTEDPTELLRVARARLREKFLAADMGITGVNFAIADSGCFCIIENESNAHHTITLPKIHVAVMGIEKLLPDLESLAYFLKLLPVSATSQKISTFVNLVGGPLAPKYGEGPEQVHVILLDNGRSQIAQDPQLRETLFCIRCGACLNHCPIYQQIGGHAYGWVYMGPIGITLIPQYLSASEGKYAPFVSSLCGACYEVCPVKINISHHLAKLRNRVVESGHSKTIERLGISGWAFLAKHPLVYRMATWLPGKIQKLLPVDKSFPAPGYASKRALGRFDAREFRNRFHDWQKAKKKGRAD